ncbi:hypothetical protein Q5M87_04830 [Brachyspira innocens]|uniref:hypothetical protein n=1 Tax=Brachyspira innocens TaxID=13264 RepID=UPI0026EE2BCE|nr:hypothetical protein [Brachyspira innocens]MDO6993329.1 hypothetical protein [Brachyspira innocens]
MCKTTSNNEYKLIFFKRAIQSLLNNNKLEIEHSILDKVNYLFISLDWINIIEVNLDEQEIQLIEKPLITKKYCNDTLNMHKSVIDIFIKLNDQNIRNELINLINTFKIIKS